MKHAIALFATTFAVVTGLFAQEVGPSPEQKRSWLSRINPFGGERVPQYKDPKLRGLKLELELSPQPVKLSEVRQLQVKLRITNLAKKPVELQFPDAQRIEIQLRNSADAILIRWSENRTFAQMMGTLLINPGEHIEYAETIATRELSPNKVYVAEVFLPKYPELDVRQKFLTAP